MVGKYKGIKISSNQTGLILFVIDLVRTDLPPNSA